MKTTGLTSVALGDILSTGRGSMENDNDSDNNNNNSNNNHNYDEHEDDLNGGRDLFGSGEAAQPWYV